MRCFVAVAALVWTACGDDSGAKPDGAAAPTITTVSPLADLVAGTPATVGFTASGSDPITWELTGAAPPGMAMDASGIFSGTPTAIGDFTFTVTATNAAGSDTLDVMQQVNAPVATAVALLDNNRVLQFAPGFPPGAGAAITLTGVNASETLVAIDRSPFNGQLYGLGFNSGTGAVRFYAVHPDAGQAVQLLVAQSFDTPTTGTTFGFDIDPALNQARVVTSTGQNFRILAHRGLAVDTDGGTVGNQRDAALNGGATTGTGCAFTNNVLDSTAETLQTISGTTVYIQHPPNTGTLGSGVAITGIQDVRGFDIPPGVNVATSGTVGNGNGYAIATLTGATAPHGGFFSLSTGLFTDAGAFTATDVRSVALSTGQRALVGATAAALVRFPETAPTMAKTSSFGTITAGEEVVAMALRPTTGQLYILGVDAAFNTGTLYLVDPASGALSSTNIGGVAMTTNGTTPVDLPMATAARYGMDFNPTADLIRVVTSTGLNFRIDPFTGAVVDGGGAGGTNPDPALNGTVSSLDGVAFTNGLGTVTAEYGISTVTDSLYLVTDPNGGTIGTPIPVTLNGVALDFTAAAAFDIPYSVTTTTLDTAVSAGHAYAALTVGSTTGLYTIDLVTGAATLVGPIGAGTSQLRALTVGQ